MTCPNCGAADRPGKLVRFISRGSGYWCAVCCELAGDDLSLLKPAWSAEGREAHEQAGAARRTIADTLAMLDQHPPTRRMLPS